MAGRLPPPPDDPDGAPPTPNDPFLYAWNRSRGHHYNLGAAQNFAQAVIADESNLYGPADLDDLRTCFLTYAGRTLRDLYNTQYVNPPNPLDLFSHRQAENARGRQYRVSRNGVVLDISPTNISHQTFLDRKAITQIHPSLHRHDSFFDRATPNGMSSDDPDEDTSNGRQFLISSKPWRSEAFTQFLRTLDLLSQAHKRELRGQPMRHRVEGPHTSSADVVPGLPVNCYSEEWLATLPEWKRIMYDIKTDEVYDFSLPSWVSTYGHLSATVFAC